jgi:23S rRNA G2069 N7-methylase RlmK/C1962 C5-methylase RlmI
MTDRPRVLDLFCCAGGAGAGYHRAGYDVTGVDIVDRPRYPHTFVQGDAIEYLRRITRTGEIERYGIVHASPPCQHRAAITKGTNKHRQHLHPDLYEPTRAALIETGLPFVIETTGIPKERTSVTLCGEMFGLAVLRHRRFELGRWKLQPPKHPAHRGYVRGWRHGVYREGPYVGAYGKGGGKPSVPEMQAAMGIDWTDVHEELTEAIPPAYTEWIGRQFVANQTLFPEVAA